MFKFIKKCLPLDFRIKYGPTYYAVKMELAIVIGKLIRLFYKPEFPKNIDGSVNLHLGCGNINHPGFINIDAIPAPHIHYVRGIDDLSPFADNSVDLIYACHCLEHFSHLKIVEVLSEWRRVLKPSGILRLSVPDFDLLVKIYQTQPGDISPIIKSLMGGQDYKYNFHYSVFNSTYLTAQLIEAGFKDVRRWEPGASDLSTFSDWSNEGIKVNGVTCPVSLNLEAVK